MLDKAQVLVNQILIKKEEVQYMKTETIKQKLVALAGLIEMAKPFLEFHEVEQEAFGEDFSEVESYFCSEEGEVLQGTPLLMLPQAYENTEHGERFGHVELFLLENGELQTFDTICEVSYCFDCQENHFSMVRFISDECILDETHIKEATDAIVCQLEEVLLSLEIEADRLLEQLV